MRFQFLKGKWREGGTPYGSLYNLSLSYSTLKDCITCSRLFLSFLHFRVSISRRSNVHKNLCHVLDIFSSFSSSFRRVSACVCWCVCARTYFTHYCLFCFFCLLGLALSSLHTLHKMIIALYLTVCFYTCTNMSL